MRLLCLDTSTRAVTVALVDDGRVLASYDEDEGGLRAGELLAPAVARVLAAAPGGVDAIAVGLGPGPFTSLRVGIATAAALADAHGIPAYGACSLDLLAAADTVVVQDARRREVYWAAYGGAGQRVSGPHVQAPAELAARLPAGSRLVGAGALLHAEALGLDPAVVPALLPSAGALWGLVVPRAAAGAPPDALTPLYLRRPDATLAAARKPVVPAR